MRRVLLAALTALVVAVGAFPAGAADTQSAVEGEAEYVVLFAEGVAPEAARAAVEAAGGVIVSENTAVGVATAVSANPSFITDATAQAALDGAARNRPIGWAPELIPAKDEDVERLEGELDTATAAAPDPGETAPEPLSYTQWDMRMIDAEPDGSYDRQQGSRRVLVGIMDTGIDGAHPDIAPNFNGALSRNFTTDIPEVDGPCEAEPDASCEDPADTDENGHGTHVAGTVGSPINDLGIAGVAPNVTLVNIRAGQDSGYFFLQPTVDAMTYAGDAGIDVVNMSFFTDPWLFNCPNNPADSPEEQLEQQTVIEATQRALDYAHARNVTFLAALGNEHTDLGNPTIDEISPDFPPGNERVREVDNSCITVPAESNHVIGVTAVGPSERKAYYSNYGVEQAEVAAPGGDFNDFPGTTNYRNPTTNLILSAWPEALALEELAVNPTSPFILRNCRGNVCGYFRYLQGTSMASPHAAGVAGLIVSQYGRRQLGGGVTMNPNLVERILERSAEDHACPEPRLQTYIVGATPTYQPIYDAYCEGSPQFNGFYGEGIVNALNAVTRRGF